MTQGADERDDTARRVPRRATPHMSVAAGCVLLAVGVLAAGWSGLLLVVAGHVVPSWALSGALLVAALMPRLARIVGRRRARDADEGRGWHRRVLILSAVVAGAGSALGALGDVATSYHVLEPSGPGGCRAVARESSFLFAGSGDVYAVGPFGIGRRMSSWTADDGYRPIASGSYALKWGIADGVLVLHGRTGDPVWPALHEIDCG